MRRGRNHLSDDRKPPASRPILAYRDRADEDSENEEDREEAAAECRRVLISEIVVRVLFLPALAVVAWYVAGC